jgi:hypothetical protein
LPDSLDHLDHDHFEFDTVRFVAIELQAVVHPGEQVEPEAEYQVLLLRPEVVQV